MEKAFKVAVILTAYDKMTRDIRAAVSQSTAEMQKLKDKSQALFGKGIAQIAGGTALAASLAPAVNAYMELEDSTTRLKTAMMGVGGVVAPEFEAVNKLAVQLGNKLPGTTADFQNMFEVMLNNGIPAKTILDGVGESAAYLAVALKLPYEEAAKMASKLKEATGTSNADMMKFLDTIAKTKNLGVEVGEMQYAFGRSAGALKLLGLQGLEASKGVAALYAELIRGGMSGETVGTGFASIVNNLLDADKMEKTNKAAAELGVSLRFFKDGKFLGLENFVQQLDKLRGFTAEQRASVVNALTGGGQDAQMLQTLINNGVEGYAKIQSAMEKQANLNEKVNAQLGTLSSIWESTTGTITNALAAIGESIGPELKTIATAIGEAGAALQEFAKAEPGIFKIISLITAAAGALLIFAGVISMIKGAWFALELMLSSSGIITFLSGVWSVLSALFTGLAFLLGISVGWLAAIVAAIAAAAIAIYVYWDEISAFFASAGEYIKTAFTSVIDWFKTLPELFYNAGLDIISGLFNGMKAKFDEGIAKVKSMASEISGAFKSVLGIQSPSRVFIEHGLNVTKGAVIGMNKGMATMGRTAAVAASVMAAPAVGMASPVGVPNTAGGGGVNITYAPQITLGAGATQAQAESFAALLKEHSRELMNIVGDAKAREERKRF